MGKGKKIKEVKEIVEDQEIKTYAEKLLKLNDERQQLKKSLESIEGERGKLIEILVELYRIKGISSVTFKDLGNVYLHIGTFPKINDPASLEKWLKENELFESMLSFNRNKLGGFCRECIEENKPLPDGVELFTKEDIRIRRG